MTPEKLTEIEALASAATPGAWEFRATEHSGGIRFVVAPNAPRNGDGTEFVPADCSHGYNGRFIAAARTAVPELCAALRQAWAERDESRATLNAVKRERDAALVVVEKSKALLASFSKHYHGIPGKLMWPEFHYLRQALERFDRVLNPYFESDAP